MKFVAPFTPAVYAIWNAIRQMAAWWQADTNVVRLMKNNPAVGAGMVIGDIVEANFEGYTGRSVVEEEFPQPYIEPVTGRLLFALAPPGNGWLFTTGGTEELPQTIYGAYVTDENATKLLGIAKFNPPIVLTAATQGINPGAIEFEVNPNVLS